MTERIRLRLDLTEATEDNNRADGISPYCPLDYFYYSLGDYQRGIQYHNQDLNFAKNVGDRVREGSASATSVEQQSIVRNT